MSGPPIRKVLVANRGLVASRLMATLRRLGIATVAVHSEADADLPYVREADEALPIGGATARDSYLNVDAIMRAAAQSGADAVHPGYGFLSENADFAQAVAATGRRFIGPDARLIRAMGNKVEARTRMASAGIPVLPASGPVNGTASSLAPLAERIGFPLLVKAAAGGGGIGMQRVAGSESLLAAVEQARKISSRAFGDEAVYLERYLEQPRHIEFQVVGDGRGRVTAIYERDCSVQRRHQKIVEESPAVGVDPDVCAAMAERLCAVLGQWGYDSLGTVEMLLDRDGRFYFLEMNTRLQVEHAVTEAVTGLDLVELQVRIAEGVPLGDLLAVVPPRAGHAIEARIYAEDPVRFFPSPGALAVYRTPALPGVRVETTFAEGNRVTPHYDPMMALLIAHGDDRPAAIRRLDAALDAFAIEGVKTNIPFLRRLIASRAHRDGECHTTFAEAFARAPERGTTCRDGKEP